jgi:hypothetical protein
MHPSLLRQFDLNTWQRRHESWLSSIEKVIAPLSNVAVLNDPMDKHG